MLLSKTLFNRCLLYMYTLERTGRKSEWKNNIQNITLGLATPFIITRNLECFNRYSIPNILCVFS